MNDNMNDNIEQVETIQSLIKKIKWCRREQNKYTKMYKKEKDIDKKILIKQLYDVTHDEFKNLNEKIHNYVHIDL